MGCHYLEDGSSIPATDLIQAFSMETTDLTLKIGILDSCVIQKD